MNVPTPKKTAPPGKNSEDERKTFVLDNFFTYRDTFKIVQNDSEKKNTKRNSAKFYNKFQKCANYIYSQRAK